MLADFAVRLVFGLVVALMLTPWRVVPLRFFRIQCQIALGVLVLASLSQATATGAVTDFWLLVTASGAAYLATVSWGLGLPSVATALDLAILGATGAWMALASSAADSGGWVMDAADRGISSLLLGGTLHSMLLGHYYLIAPAMTISPLNRSLDLLAAAIAGRCALAGIATWLGPHGSAAISPGHLPGDVAILAMRWGMGVVGVGVSVVLARRTAAIRSTQSATGILYITTIFVLFGELATIAMNWRPGAG
jgi:hypothetical protein